jgi:hypothetical protein
LPRQSGHHAGVALARTLYEKLSSYGVTSDRIRWFVADNASNNDTCLEVLSELLEFEAIEHDVVKADRWCCRNCHAWAECHMPMVVREMACEYKRTA